LIGGEGWRNRWEAGKRHGRGEDVVVEWVTLSAMSNALDDGQKEDAGSATGEPPLSPRL